MKTQSDYYLRPEGNKIFMCCGKAKCPSVNLSGNDMIEISDDYGNTVKMKKDEARLITEAVNKLKDLKQP